MTKENIIEKLELIAHPEGGFYKETYRSETILTKEALIPNFQGIRNISTAIYFLIDKGNFSAFHKIKSDELWHFYTGDALEVIEIDSKGELKKTLIGDKLAEGHHFQYMVKANAWFASRVLDGGAFSLVGCTVAPGFDFEDFELANQKELSKEFPQHKMIIKELTRV